MEWTMINVEVPTPLVEIVKGIQTIDKQTILAGGFMTDLYLGTPYHDVDIFVSDNNQHDVARWLRKEGYTITCKDEYSGIKVFSHEGMVMEFMCGEYKIQLIPTTYGKEILSYFDLRIREMYFDGNNSYASEKALANIQDKTLELGSITYAVRTYYRLLKYSQKYSFQVDEGSLDWIKQCLHDQYTSDLTQFIDNKVKEAELKQEMIHVIENHSVKGQFIYQKGKSNTIEALLKNPQQSSTWQQVMHKRVNVDQTVTIPFSLTEAMERYRQAKEEAKMMIKRSTTVLMFDEPDLAEEWRHHIDNDDYFYALFLSIFNNRNWEGDMKEQAVIIKKQLTVMEEIKQSLRKEREAMDVYMTDSSIPYYVMQKEGWDAYYNGQLLYIEPKRGYGHIYYRMDTDMWHQRNMDVHLFEKIQTYVYDHIVGVKI